MIHYPDMVRMVERASALIDEDAKIPEQLRNIGICADCLHGAVDAICDSTKVTELHEPANVSLFMGFIYGWIAAKDL